MRQLQRGLSASIMLSQSLYVSADSHGHPSGEMAQPHQSETDHQCEPHRSTKKLQMARGQQMPLIPYAYVRCSGLVA